MILFVDDLKLPDWYEIKSDYTWVRSGETAIEAWKNGKYDEIYLDHDMGLGLDGSQALKKICEMGPLPKCVTIISWNSVGIYRIKYVCKDFNIPYKLHGLINETN